MKQKSKVNPENKSILILSLILVILIIIAGVLLVLKFLNASKTNNDVSINAPTNNIEKEIKPEIKQPKTMQGNQRPIAVMLDNNINAVPQGGLEQADIVYEIIVEGGESRLMAIFKNKEDISRIGPIRSARHYFLDYAFENDAIYVHYGQSPQAEGDIKRLAVNNINGIYESTKDFWRDSSRYAPHNAVTSMNNLLNLASKKSYRMTSSKKNLLNYVVEEINLDENENTESNDISKSKQATIVNIPYSPSNKVKYEYNAEKKEYVRYTRKKQQTDWNTKNPISVKNIIITKCKNTTLNDGSGKGRQTLNNIKTLDGYYITNGRAIPIKCEKSSRKDKTIYKSLDGKEINVNDGKTFIQICPEESVITFE